MIRTTDLAGGAQPPPSPVPLADVGFFFRREGFGGLRLQFPRWGKDKLAVLLGRQKVAISVSMVGRILTRLQQQGRLVEAPRSGVPGSRRALRPRPYAVRKPREYAASQPGDLVEVDTLDVRPIPGVVFKQFTARDGPLSCRECPGDTA